MVDQLEGHDTTNLPADSTSTSSAGVWYHERIDVLIATVAVKTPDDLAAARALIEEQA